MRALIMPVRPLLLAVVAALSAQAASAQRVDPQRVFDVTVQVAGQVMSATIRDGGEFQLTLDRTDEYRLMPVVAGRDGRTVTMAVYRATAGQPSTKRMVERIELSVGQPATLRTRPEFSLVVDRIRSAPPARPTVAVRPISFTASASWRRAVQGDQCCVCCGRACGCACGVEMSCGSCCMPGCCSINETSNPRGGGEDARRAGLFAAFLGGSACERAFPAAAVETRVATR